MVDTFSLFSSMRFDDNLTQVPEKSLENAGWNYRNKSPLYLLDFHRDRLLRAAIHWQWEQAIKLLSGDDALAYLSKRAEEFVGPGQDTPLLLKATIDQKGTLEFSKFDTPPTTLERLFPRRFPEPGATLESDDPQSPLPFTLLLDEVPITRSEYTHFKTTKRAMYDAARQRAGITVKNRREVLVVNQDDGSIMEGSITTPYFWREGEWVTPPVSDKFSWEEGSGGQDGTSRRWALERGLATEQVVSASSLTDGEECWLSNGTRGFFPATISLRNTTT